MMRPAVMTWLRRWARPIARRLPAFAREPLRRWWWRLSRDGLGAGTAAAPAAAPVVPSPAEAAAPAGPPLAEYDHRLAQERSIFSAQAELQALPAIYHYWSNRYIRPIFESFGFSYPEDFFARTIAAQRMALGRPVSVVSLGCGDGESEVRVAALLVERGIGDFSLECFDLNPELLERARRRAEDAGVAAHFRFSAGDLNDWQPTRRYDVIMANQSLHHVLELERLFDRVRGAMDEAGVFAASDMIGRNGHMRWPEAFEIVQEYWREIPSERRYNVQLRRHEPEYLNWDCSGEGFEGVRAQDILPLLIERFGFELFVAYGNVIDPFVDRAFGANFDAGSEADRAFIDRVHARDEAEMLAGRIKPTHMLALMRRERGVATRCYQNLTPAFCLRDPRDDAPIVSSPSGGRATCPICHSASGGAIELGTVAATHPGPFEVSEYRLVHCPVCDAVRLDPLPSAEDLRTLYQRSVQFSDAHYTDEVQVGRMLSYYGACLDDYKLLPAPGEASLEVGAGLAWVSRASKQRAPGVRTVAQDVTSECAQRCPWVDDYVVGEIGRVPPELRFKLISMTHVIEHLVDPQAMLVDLAARLGPGGRIFVTAPFRPSGWRAGGGIDAWRGYSYLHVPAHVSYLSKRWFELTAARCGLDLLRWDPSHEDGQAFEAILGTR
jgi:trans-aconitate methyltransferase